MSAHEIATYAVQAMRDTRANRSSARIAGAVLKGLHRAGYAVVELPAPDEVGGDDAEWYEDGWYVNHEPRLPATQAVRVNVTGMHMPATRARRFAAALLAAADAAEHPGTPVEASPQEQQ